MLAYSASSSSSSSSSSFFLVLLRLLRRRAAQCPVSAGNRHVQCQPATAIIGAQCSLPDLNRDHLLSVFPAGPQPRPSALGVPCRTSTATEVIFHMSNPFEFKEMLEWHCIDVWPSRGSRKASRGPRRGTLLPSTLSYTSTCFPALAGFLCHVFRFRYIYKYYFYKLLTSSRLREHQEHQLVPCRCGHGV